MKTFRVLVVMAALCVALLAGVLIGGNGPAPAQALSVTPVANLVTSNARQLFQPMTAKALTADATTGAMEISSFSWADFAYTVDEGTSNPFTVTVQYSNDKSNWVSGATIAANVSSDGSDMTRLPLFGQYMRLSADVENTNTVTLTLSALAR
jgi:hypothetical protein